MASKSVELSMRASRPLLDAILVALISLTVVGGTVGGFLIGRHVTRDAFIEKINGQSSVEKTTLLSAGTAPRSLYQAVAKDIDDPLRVKALANAYGVLDGDRDALVKRLSDIVLGRRRIGRPHSWATLRGHARGQPAHQCAGFQGQARQL